PCSTGAPRRARSSGRTARWPTRSFQRKNNDSVGLRVSAAGGGLRVGPLKAAVDGGAGDGEHLGEVGDGVLAGGGHPGQLALLPGGQLRLLAMQLALARATAMPSRVRIRS